MFKVQSACFLVSGIKNWSWGGYQVGLPPAGTYLINDNDNLLEFRVPHSQTSTKWTRFSSVSRAHGTKTAAWCTLIYIRQLWSKSKTAGFALLWWQHAFHSGMVWSHATVGDSFFWWAASDSRGEFASFPLTCHVTKQGSTGLLPASDSRQRNLGSKKINPQIVPHCANYL